MKRIINGVTYNTDTATHISGEGHEFTSAGWDLYQTRHGAFFMVITDYDDSLRIEPCTDEAAQAFLEKHANHLVEQVFGTFPEAGAAERRLTIRVPGSLADRLEAAAKTKGVSLNSYAMRCFEQCTTADGQPPPLI